MIIHFCFHHLFDGAAKQILKRILDIFSGFNIILLKTLLLLAIYRKLTPGDFDFEKQTLRMNKTFHRSKGNSVPIP